MSNERVTKEQIKAIRDASEAETCASIARRLDINPKSVEYHRRKQKTAHRNDFLAANGMSKPASVTAVDSAQTIDWEPEPETKLPRSCTVALDVNEKTLDAWWMAQNLQTKAKLFGGNYVIRVEGFVS